MVVTAEDLAEAFSRFDRENPAVFQELRRLALELKAAGRQHYGLKSLFEVLRWEYALKTEGEAFKLNNNYTAFYARMLMAAEPDLQGFFEIREAKADDDRAG